MGKADGFECGDPFGSVPSFECSKARTPVERAICDSERLRSKDCLLKYAYYDALNAAADSCAQAAIRGEQSAWIRSRARECASAPSLSECIEGFYEKRGIELISKYGLKSEVYGREHFATPALAKTSHEVARSPAPSVQKIEDEPSDRDEWLSFGKKHWDLILAVYIAVLGALAWRDRKGFDSRGKAIATRTALYLFALPFAIAWLLLKVVWFGLKREAFGSAGGTSVATAAKPRSAEPLEVVADERVSIEIQDIGGGSWKKITTAPNNPAAIRATFQNLRAGGSDRRMRAVGIRTGQLYDLQ